MMADRSLPIPKALIGQIRTWRNALARDEDTAMAAERQALAPLRETMRSRPASDWLIRQAASRWEQAADGPDRIAFSITQPTRHVYLLTEVRAFATERRDTTWTEDERGLLVLTTTFRIERRKLRPEVQPVSFLSDHALARRLEREGGCSIAQALTDTVDALSWALACFDFWTPTPAKRAPIVVPTQTGHWRGWLGKVDDLHDQSQPVPLLRTWLPDEAIADEQFLGTLATLRRARVPDLNDAEKVALKSALARLTRADEG